MPDGNAIVLTDDSGERWAEHFRTKEAADEYQRAPKHRDEEAKKNPTFVVQAPTPAGAGASLRTTYDAAPYDPSANPVQGGWASAKSPYAFSVPDNAQVGGR